MTLPNKPKILAATYNPVSKTKMISFLVDFPTVLLAELRTHRILTQGSLYEHMELDDFNMSANSARAIPANKYLQRILDNPFVPIWTKQQKGMSGEVIPSIDEIDSYDFEEIMEFGSEEEKAKYKVYKEYFELCKLWDDILTGEEDVEMCSTTDNDGYHGTQSEAERRGYNISKMNEWTDKGKTGIREWYNALLKTGIHKQNANRLLAPFAYTTCILSGTEFENFFSLRLSKDAQPEFREIAILLKELYDNANWKENKYHIPFEDEIEFLHKDNILDKLGYGEIGYSFNEESYNEYLMKVSASMCAKLSYNTQDNEDSLEKHLERANMLIESKHYEPFSHQAIAMDKEEYHFFQRHYLIKRDKYNDSNAQSFKLLSLAREDGLVGAIEYGHCWNLRGFISQRYKIENL